ncbi:Guanylylate cyclase-domain-containing protein [Obelidium mucronatum]|nr:Guanylylate cyclase-domain-containing protein [Obelidium mucronatum]
MLQTPPHRHPPHRKLSRNRRLILSLASSVPHITQPSQWDCGLTCVSMVLKSLKLYSQSDPVDLRLFVHRDAVENGSVWTIDLAYLFRAFGVSDFTYYTSHIGVNFHYAQKSYYRSAFPTDSRRIHSLFADAHDSGVRVVPLLLPLDDIKRFLSSGRYAVLMLVNLNAINCRVCRRRERNVAICVKRTRWQRLGLGWLCGNPQDVIDEMETERPVDFDVGVDSYLYLSEYNTGMDSGDEEDNEADCDSGVALISAKSQKRTKKRRHDFAAGVGNYSKREIDPHVAIPVLPVSQPASTSNESSTFHHSNRMAPRKFTERTPLLDHAAKPTNLQQSMSSSYTSNAGHPLRRINSNSSVHTYRAYAENSVVDSAESFSIVKTVSNTVSWIGAFVFRSNDNEDDRVSASQNTTPLLTARYEAALQMPNTSFEITPPQISISTSSISGSLNSSEQTPKASKLTTKVPPGVGIVSTVHDENFSDRVEGGHPSLKHRVNSAAASISSVQPPTVKSQTGSASTSPLRPGSVFAAFQQSKKQEEKLSLHESPANIVPQFRFPMGATLSPNEQQPSMSPSPSPIPSFLSFLTPREHPSERKHRAFSIPGTDSEKLAAVAATAASRTSNTTTALSKTAGLMSEFERNENSVFFAGSGGGGGRRKGVVSFAANHVISPEKGVTLVSPSPLSAATASQSPPPSPAVSRRDEIFGNKAATAKVGSNSATSRRDEIFGRLSKASSAAPTASGGSTSSSTTTPPTSRRDEIFGKCVASAAESSSSNKLSNGVGNYGNALAAGSGAEAKVEPPEQERRSSLSFWDLRKRILQQETTVDESSDSTGEEEEEEKEDPEGSSASGSHLRNNHQQSAVPSHQRYPQQFKNDGESECSGDGFESDEDYESEDEYWSVSDGDNDGHNKWGPSCFGNIFQSGQLLGNSGSVPGVLSNWFGKRSDDGRGNLLANNSDDTPLEFEGHYILFIGYDAKTDGFIYRDPGTEERLCVMDSFAVEHARAGVPGSDHDVIVVRAGK